ncbi:hypothetical protein PYW07_010123 [Mythimna separata]|uniref:C2H2-type domain-containing protein n=1 Tax=Mythimna separata TaxID=271217 RepID=A0AAD7YIG3_MYTSE|nr:hypothetical protein PYW07_010123 [Mythimna separata]
MDANKNRIKARLNKKINLEYETSNRAAFLYIDLSEASMSYLLHASGVVTGSLSCFCLACDAFLQSARHATHHVGTAEHQQKAGAVQLSDKFPHDHIKKFKRGYYCEFCNVLMPIASKVNVHITEDEHKHNKGVLLLKPLGLDVVAFNNVLIEEKAWHGLIEGVCSLCNAEFEDEEDHKADAEHSLNLVLKPIQFAADNAIFRHLDDTASQCLICNKLLAPGRMSEHFVNAEHLEIYAKQHIETNGACRGTETEEITAVTENNDKVDDCDNPPTENFEKDIEEEETRDFAKANKLTYNKNNKKSFCRICEVHLPASFKSIKEHVEGTNHRRLVASSTPSTTEPKDPGNLSKQETIKFIKSTVDIETPFNIVTIINLKYCILPNSLSLIWKNDSRIRCVLCNMNLPPHSNVSDHINTRQHSLKWINVPVITSERNEFIREVHPGLYHCGFCHLVVSGWTDMKRHLECSDHVQRKAVWEQRLRDHKAGAQEFLRLHPQTVFVQLMKMLNE